MGEAAAYARRPALARHGKALACVIIAVALTDVDVIFYD
jgi:hypothetical protein